MPKLNDTQAILLSHAAQEANGSFLPPPDKFASATGKVANALGRLKTIGLAEEREAGAAAAYREDGDLRFGLFITVAGLRAIGIEPEGADEASAAPTPPVPAPRLTKSTAVLALLQREQGATVTELVTATGWLPHTTRAALTGLRKKGHAIEKSRRDEVTCYRVAAQ